MSIQKVQHSAISFLVHTVKFVTQTQRQEHGVHVPQIKLVLTVPQPQQHPIVKSVINALEAPLM